MPEPGIKLSRLKMGRWTHRGIKMKRIIVFVACMCALAVFASRPSVGVQSQAAMETLSPFAMMMETSQWLPTESYDAI